MIDVFLAYDIFDRIRDKRDSFGVTQTRTITSITHRQLIVDAPIAGDYELGVVEVMTELSPAHYMFNIIESIASNVITLDRPYMGKRIPEVGDVIEVHGGPLGRCGVYFGVPPTLTPKLIANREFFVTVEPRQGDRSIDTVFGRGLKGRQGLKDTVGFRIILETPWGEEGTEREAMHNYIELPTFMHQVLYHTFRTQAQESQSIWVGGDVAWNYQTMEHKGINGPVQTAIVELDMVAK